MQISAQLVKHSLSQESGVRLRTWLLEYPRIIHGELLTHRVFSKNSASSRAIPIDKVIAMVETDPAEPVHWGANQAGMSARVEVEDKEAARRAWKEASLAAVEQARKLQSLGLHKQVVNRVLEPFQWMRVVLTGTEFENFWWLRDHPDADPTLQRLASLMHEIDKASKPNLLKEGEWHLPFVESSRVNGRQVFKDGMQLADALKLSVSLCAQTSFRKQDDSLEKATDLYKRLVESEPCHSSPTEHQALCATEGNLEGWTHMAANGSLWSGNLRGWVQYRQTIPNNAKYG